MEELNQGNKEFINSNDGNSVNLEANCNGYIENVDPINSESELFDENIKSSEEILEDTELITEKPAEEKNFFAEENYYDTHPLPTQVPPQPVYQQQGYIPQNFQQPPQYNQPYYQGQFQQTVYRPQSYQQQPYNPVYNGQPVQSFNQQFDRQCTVTPQPQFQQNPPAPNSTQPNYYGIPPQPPQNFQKPKGGLSSGAIVGIVIAALLIVGLICIFLILNDRNNNDDLGNFSNYSENENKNDQIIQIPTSPKPDVEEKYKEDDGRYTTQGIAKVVSPSVVGIIVYGDGQFIAPISQASGIIISTDGYIATNAHVIEGGSDQKVIMNDGTEYIAKVVGSDAKSDLAVLKIEPKSEIVAAEIGNSDQLELGEQVMAIGNPSGLSNSITGGYVSGLDRQIRSSDTGLAMSCIQTDASVNPGNSGGALVNMYGQVVGIISSKLIATDYEGIGFAISINEALPIFEDIINMGYVSNRVRIGIVFLGLTDTTANMHDLVPGLYINEIDPTCDIANSGLAINDIITEINGQKVYDADTVMEAIEGQKPGETVTAKVYRKSIIGEVSEFEITFKLMADTSVN